MVKPSSAFLLAAALGTVAAAPAFVDLQDARLVRESAQSTAVVQAAAAGAIAGGATDELLIGEAYEWGAGLPQDYGAASQWYGRSALHGSPAAMVALGVLLDNGTGVVADPSRAVGLFAAAVAAGSVAGQIRLGMAFEWGRGVEADLCRAASYYAHAAGQGEPIADLYGVLLYQARAPAPDCSKHAGVALNAECIQLGEYATAAGPHCL